MVVLYSIIVGLYGILVRLAAFFNPKASLWVKGRQGLFEKLEPSILKIRSEKPGSQLIWFHCASLGEFEQGRPLIETLRWNYPDLLILITFQSPSGYEVRKLYPQADVVTYLPLDTPGNARRFLNIVKPDLVVFVKYEFWFNYLALIQKLRIPVYLVSAVFRADQHFFKWYGYWPRQILKGFSHIFVQNEYSREILEFVDITNVTVSGDTRFDRVADLIKSPAEFPYIQEFCADARVLVAGSTWPSDEELLLGILQQLPSGVKLLIVPHEIQESHINALMERNRGMAARYSEQKALDTQIKILIIDTIGMLNKIYRFGQIAYVGGGFGTGIHNILEPAVYGIPVIFGPNYFKFSEAVDLISLQGAFTVKNKAELLDILNRLLNDEAFLQRASETCSSYIHQKTGATELIMKFMAKEIRKL